MLIETTLAMIAPRTPSGKVIFPPLTERQSEVLKYFVDFAEENRAWPTQRDVGGRFGISQSAIYNVLNSLTRKGYITRQNRTVVLTEVGTEWYQRNFLKGAEQLVLPMPGANGDS